jgi:hypothetical protein
MRPLHPSGIECPDNDGAAKIKGENGFCFAMGLCYYIKTFSGYK